MLILCILFSTVVNAVYVAQLLISRILFSNSVILVSQLVFSTRPLVPGILFDNGFVSVILSF